MSYTIVICDFEKIVTKENCTEFFNVERRGIYLIPLAVVGDEQHLHELKEVVVPGRAVREDSDVILRNPNNNYKFAPNVSPK